MQPVSASTPATVLDDSYPATVPIDGREVRLRIKRFTIDEFTRWSADFNKIGRFNRKGELFVEKHRQPLRDDDGQPVRAPEALPNPLAGKPMVDAAGAPVCDEHGVPRIETPTLPNPQAGRLVFEDPLTTIARLELEQPEALAAFEKQAAVEEEFSQQFMREALRQYVSVEVNQLMMGDGRTPLTTGEQLLDRFGGRADVLQAVLQAIQIENTLSEDQKKRLRLRFASASSSDESTRVAPGGGPATTADAVAPSSSTPIDGAMPTTTAPAMSSGSTDRSS